MTVIVVLEDTPRVDETDRGEEGEEAADAAEDRSGTVMHVSWGGGSWALKKGCGGMVFKLTVMKREGSQIVSCEKGECEDTFFLRAVLLLRQHPQSADVELVTSFISAILVCSRCECE